MTISRAKARAHLDKVISLIRERGEVSREEIAINCGIARDLVGGHVGTWVTDGHIIETTGLAGPKQAWNKRYGLGRKAAAKVDPPAPVPDEDREIVLGQLAFGPLSAEDLADHLDGGTASAELTLRTMAAHSLIRRRIDDLWELAGAAFERVIERLGPANICTHTMKNLMMLPTAEARELVEDWCQQGLVVFCGRSYTVGPKWLEQKKEAARCLSNVDETLT